VGDAVEHPPHAAFALKTGRPRQSFRPIFGRSDDPGTVRAVVMYFHLVFRRIVVLRQFRLTIVSHLSWMTERTLKTVEISTAEKAGGPPGMDRPSDAEAEILA